MKGPSGHPTLRRRRTVGGVVLVVLLGIGLLIAHQWQQSRACAVNSAGAPTCGQWWGSALPATSSTLPAAVAALQTSTGRRLDIVHTYHRWYDTFPTTTEQALAHDGHLLLLNWEPVDPNGTNMSWAAIAAGSHDAQIDALASRLRGLPNVLISFSHEPEVNYGAHGDAAAFVAATRHIHDRMAADGVRNVGWVWDVEGLSDPVWQARYLAMWPGNAYVDWVAWDPYNWGSCRNRTFQSFAQTVTPFYDWLQAHGFGDKPFMLGEYGTVEQTGDPGGKAAWFNAIPQALKKLPNLRALVYFDLPAPPANCNWQIDTSATSAAAFTRLARSSPFAATAKLAPS